MKKKIIFSVQLFQFLIVVSAIQLSVWLNCDYCIVMLFMFEVAQVKEIAL